MTRWSKAAGWMVVSGMVLGQAESGYAQSANYLDQGWSTADRQYFYRTGQGSRLMSYRIFKALDTSFPNDAGGWTTGKFMSQANLSRLGFLFDADTTNNPDGLPIGFVKDSSVTGKPDQIGLTCATCHTRDVVFKSASGVSTRYRIDGAQSYVDTERFLQQLQGALGDPLNNTIEFDKLCATLGATTAAAKAQVRTELSDAYQKINEENLANLPTSGVNSPGPGRLDALAHIKNRVANTVFPGQYAFAGNNVDATAPVSFPFLWDAPYLDHVQYPSNVPNASIGSLARNVGEVTGVFAETKTARTLGVFTASSTANVPNLVGLENRVLNLKSPPWPTAQSPLNQTLVAQGDTLFGDYCTSCHKEVDRGPRSQWIQVYAVGQSFVKTDITQADNNIYDQAFAGQTSSDASKLVNPLEILTSIEINLLIPEAWRTFDLNASHKQSGAPNPVTTTLDDGTNTLEAGEDKLHSYKSRPLNGIWATGPYLHNGSVRTLADLLLPGSLRPNAFCVGSLEIDTAGVGMKNDCSVREVYTFDGKQTGNLPVGHEYGTKDDYRVKAGWLPELTAGQRLALVEYMKTL